MLSEFKLRKEVKPVKGIPPVSIAARQNGLRGVIIPRGNANEAAVVNEVEVLPVRRLSVASGSGLVLCTTMLFTLHQAFKPLEYPADHRVMNTQIVPHLFQSLAIGSLGTHYRLGNSRALGDCSTARSRSRSLRQERWRPVQDSLTRYDTGHPETARGEDGPWGTMPPDGCKEQDLTPRSILGYFGLEESLAQKHYEEFTENALGSETENPLREALASTVLGTPAFISWVKENLISSESRDMRNVPAVRQLVDKPSLEYIEKVVESVVGRGHVFFEKFCIYASHQYGGLSLKEIGAYYGMRGPAISQSSRRFKERILGDKKLTKTVAEILSRIGWIGSRG